MTTALAARSRWIVLWRDPTTWLTLGLVAHVIVAAICASSPAGHVGDFHRYWELATTPGRAYIDYAAEYPPGAILLFKVLAGLAGNELTFYAWLLFANMAADVAIVAVLAGAWGVPAAAVYTWVGLPILSLLFFRFDLWTMAAVTGAVALWLHRHERTAVAVLCAGAAVKIWPLPFIALLVTVRRPWTSSANRWLAGLALAAVGLWFTWSGLDGFRQVLTFRGATGWDIESGIGSIWRLAEPATMRMESGALRVGYNLPLVSVALFVLSMPVALWGIWRGAATGRLGTGWVAGMSAVLACSALLSPQFLGWLLPGAAMAWAEGERRTTRTVAWLVAWTVLYRILHTREVPHLVLVRNVVLVVCVAGLLRLLAAEPAEDRLVFRFEPEPPPGAGITGEEDERGGELRPLSLE